jgi:hypothetical protein
MEVAAAEPAGIVAGLNEHARPAGRDVELQARWTTEPNTPKVGMMLTVTDPPPFSASESAEGLIDKLNPPVLANCMPAEVDPT